MTPTNRTLNDTVIAAAIVALGLAAGAAPANAQDGTEESSLREAMIDDVQAECNALASAGDSRVTDCEEAVGDMRRSTSPVVVARIRDQYRARRDERVAAAATRAFDLYEEREDYDWAPYGNEIAD